MQQPGEEPCSKSPKDRQDASLCFFLCLKREGESTPPPPSCSHLHSTLSAMFALFPHQVGLLSSQPRAESANSWLGKRAARRLFAHLPRELPLQVIADHHFLQLHNVGVLELQQQGDFSQAADGDPCGGEDPAKMGAAGATPRAKPARSPLCSPSFSLSIRTFFRATISPVCVSRARSETARQPRFPGSPDPLLQVPRSAFHKGTTLTPPPSQKLPII